MAKGNKGRGIALSKEQVDKLAEFVRTGVTLDVAAMALGVHPRTIQRYIADAAALIMGHPRSERFTPKYKAFLSYLYKVVSSAEAQAEIEMAKAITEAAKVEWKAALEWLSRRRPGRWSSMSKRVITSNRLEELSGGIRDLRELPSSELERLLETSSFPEEEVKALPSQSGGE